MIYLFEASNNNASVVYLEDYLDEKSKKLGFAVESLPECEYITGKIPVLKCDVSLKKVWYEYEDEPKSEVDIMKQQLTDIQFALDEMLMGGM